MINVILNAYNSGKRYVLVSDVNAAYNQLDAFAYSMYASVKGLFLNATRVVPRRADGIVTSVNIYKKDGTSFAIKKLKEAPVVDLSTGYYAADFETANDKGAVASGITYVWGWGIRPLSSKGVTESPVVCGSTMVEFMNYVEADSNLKRVYFHNLGGFDGWFIIDYLRHTLGYGQVDAYLPDRKCYSVTLAEGRPVRICVKFWHGRVVEFIDSVKIAPMPLDTLASKFKLGINKIKKGADFYTKYRPEGYVMTTDEVDYLVHDVVILSQVMHKVVNLGLKGLTIGGCALSEVLDSVDTSLLPCDSREWYDTISPAYQGGLGIINCPLDVDIFTIGCSFDVKSMYPYFLRHKKLPYGNATLIDTIKYSDLLEDIDDAGYYKGDKVLFVELLLFDICPKPGIVPCFRYKNYSGVDTYIASYKDFIGYKGSIGTKVTLTSADLAVLKRHYNVSCSVLNIWQYATCLGLFDRYIDKWYGLKNKAEKIGDYGTRTVAKLMLNNVLGKLGQKKLTKVHKLRYNDTFDDEGIYIQNRGAVDSEASGEVLRDTFSFVAIPAFVNSLGRLLISTLGNDSDIKGKLLYTAVDSMYIKDITAYHFGQILSKYGGSNEYKLGSDIGNWEPTEFICFRVLAHNIYAYITPDNKVTYKCSGFNMSTCRVVDILTDNTHEMQWSDFKRSTTIEYKEPVHAIGGVVIVNKRKRLVSSKIRYKR